MTTTTTTTINEFGGGINDNNALIQEWVDATMKTAISLDPHSYIPELFWSENTRPDGRIFGQARKTSITTNVLERNGVLGSSLVKFETTTTTTTTTTTSTKSAITTTNTSTLSLLSLSSSSSTQVLVGVTAEIGQPSGGGNGDIKITCVPALPALESWLQRLVIKVINLEQLMIQPGKSAFGLQVTIAVLNENGNVKDACLLATIAALQNTTLPPIVVVQQQQQQQDGNGGGGGGGRIYTLENDQIRNELPTSWITFPSKKLHLSIIPLPLSMGVITTQRQQQKDDEEAAAAAADNSNSKQQQQWFLVDPSKEEATVCKGGITIVVDGYNLDKILSLEYNQQCGQQQQQISMKQSDLALAIRMAQGRAKELLPLFSVKS